MLRLLTPIFLFTVFLGIYFVGVATSNHIGITACFGAFAVCYILTVFFGILDLIVKIAEDPYSGVFQKSIFKVLEKSPFLLGTILFSAVLLTATFFSPAKRFRSLSHFSLVLLLCLLFYFFELTVTRNRLKRHLRSTDKIQKEPGSRNRIQSSSQNSPDSRKKLLLINPMNQGMLGLAGFGFTAKLQPLALPIIAALTPDDFHVDLIDETVEAFQYRHADFVAITGLTSSACRAYEIASHYRRNGIPVVMGGIHASMMPEEALEYVDCVVIGEAESVWTDVIVDFLDGNLKKRYQAVPVDLQSMVRPKREIFSERYPWDSVQTSRGCPMDCDFCSVTVFNGRQYRLRPIEEVLNELEAISNPNILFVDDNLIGYSKNSTQRAKDLFNGMIERNLKKRWICQAAVNFGADDELLSLAQESGCYAVLLGFESDDPNELVDMNKRFNLQFQYRKIMKNLHKHQILVYGTFIYGTENESRQSMWRKTGFICRNRVDFIQITTMTPLPGTRLFEKARKENRLVHTDFPRDWERYNMLEYTYQLKEFDEEAFTKEMKKCMNRIFSKWTLSKKLLKSMIYTRRPVEGIGAYVANSVFGEMWEKSFSIIDARFKNEER